MKVLAWVYAAIIVFFVVVGPWWYAPIAVGAVASGFMLGRMFR